MTELDFAGFAAIVERRMLEGQPLGRVEEFIERQPLPDDTKAALWLLAWSMEQAPRVSRASWVTDVDVAHD